MLLFIINMMCLFYLYFVLPLACIIGLVLLVGYGISVIFHSFNHITYNDSIEQMLEHIVIVDNPQHETHVTLYGSGENYSIVVKKVCTAYACINE